MEILDGVEGLVHISELAPHHVENPREIVAPGDDVKVKILEIDSERRRLSLSVKRVEGQVLEPKVLPQEPPADAGAGDLDDVPQLGLSEEFFSGEPAAAEAGDGVVGEPAAGYGDDVAGEPAPDGSAGEPVADGAVAEPAESEPVADGTVAEPAAVAPEAVEPEADDPAAS